MRWDVIRLPRRASVFSVEKAARDRAVGVDAPIAQERPVAPRLLDARAIAFHDQNLLLGWRRLLEDRAERIGHERSAPELDPTVGVPFMTDAIASRDVDTVG